MSRIGNLPINVPDGVSVDIQGDIVVVKGAKGEMQQKVNGVIKVKVEENKVVLENSLITKKSKSLHGLYRALINNMITGVSEGHKLQQEVVGVGYRAAMQGQVMELGLGFSHNIYIEIPKEVKASVESAKGKNPIITLESCDKQLLGFVAAKIREFRKPEPYKGKGIRFVGEQVRRKASKAVAKD